MVGMEMGAWWGWRGGVVGMERGRVRLIGNLKARKSC